MQQNQIIQRIAKQQPISLTKYKPNERMGGPVYAEFTYEKPKKLWSLNNLTLSKREQNSVVRFSLYLDSVCKNVSATIISPYK